MVVHLSTVPFYLLFIFDALCRSVFGGALGYHFTCYLFYACAALYVVVHLLTVCAAPYVVVQLLNVLFVIFDGVCSSVCGGAFA